jgi:hypothetical protein
MEPPSATAGYQWDANLHSQHATGLGFSSLAFALDGVISITIGALLSRMKSEFAQ